MYTTNDCLKKYFFGYDTNGDGNKYVRCPAECVVDVSKYFELPLSDRENQEITITFDHNVLKKELMMNTSKTNYTIYGDRKYQFEYRKIIFSPPYTIVIWRDGSKTMVKCSENDTYDAEKALALCFMKRALNIKANHQLHKFFKKEINNEKNWPKKKEK